MKAKKAKAKARALPKIPLKYFVAVEQGTKFLDLILGRKVWLRRMNMRKFNIEQGNVCVAGNVFKDALFDGADDGYDSFLNAINTIGEGGAKDSASLRFGFHATTDKGWQYLQDIWVRRITMMKKRMA